MTLAIIGGTGLDQWSGATLLTEEGQKTAWGDASAPVQRGEIAGVEVLFLPRHGSAHDIPPHRVNYRANIDALRAAGASRIIGVAAVGGIAPKFAPGMVALPQQLIDYSYGREATFFDGVQEPLQHVEFTQPYHPELRQALLAAAKKAMVPIADEGIYGVTQGPRLETAAEIQRMARDGCTMVGMTGMPEAVLAKERDMPYACLAFSVNWAAGLGEGGIHDQIEQSIAEGGQKIRAIVMAFLK